ncbi:hypothetical protein, partial [Hyella patelloides]|uniref:hypothetical protein n=1 Tax=Hyella patelloides TaxID=1982969 RepID=UPI001C953FD2
CDADWNSNHRLLFYRRDLTPGSNIDAVCFLANSDRLFCEKSGITLLSFLFVCSQSKRLERKIASWRLTRS